ncbi:cysteine-rich PDZ-binding protein [Hesseltinella vesiculosa]|uniref:Cysteine-rich PDZ-binding protein n=1 Tax=Hesseltinella vesiculosa TaxID=101127 RepID=A0A1X2GLK4_9FUNG|nr:cysteine-rich PDZ-binding protein [Hesseltinella vesiculosa]
MVCAKCEKKLTTLAVPDKWKDGAKNVKAGQEGRKINQNKLIAKGKSRHSPYESKCRICKSKVIQPKAHYCQNCSFQKGICAMCGKNLKK